VPAISNVEVIPSVRSFHCVPEAISLQSSYLIRHISQNFDSSSTNGSAEKFGTTIQRSWKSANNFSGGISKKKTRD